MAKKYANLEQLLQNDRAAHKLFAGLPEYVREGCRERADGIDSLDSLQACIDHMTRGDG